MRFLHDTVNAEGFGFNGIIKNYRYFKHILNKTVAPFLQQDKPDLVILIDFYGFNIHVAKKARALNIPVVYYISPQVWASRTWRINKLEKYVNHMLLIFPFEQQIYKDRHITTTFIGHPLLDILTPVTRESVHPKDEVTIGLFPGSRRQEVERLLLMMCEVFSEIPLDRIRLIVFAAPAIDQKRIASILKSKGLHERSEIIDGSRYDLRRSLRFCLISSGTATVEMMILGVPMIIMYRMPWLSYYIAHMLIKIKYIGMPNILAEKQIVPEFVQHIDIDKVRDLVTQWISSDETVARLQKDLILTTKQLGEKGAIKRAVAILHQYIK